LGGKEGKGELAAAESAYWVAGMNLNANISVPAIDAREDGGKKKKPHKKARTSASSIL